MAVQLNSIAVSARMSIKTVQNYITSLQYKICMYLVILALRLEAGSFSLKGGQT